MTEKVEKSQPRSVKPANKRGVARLAAVQALYQMDVGEVPMTNVISEFTAFRLGKELDGEQYREADEQWFKSIVSGVVSDQKLIDPFIHKALVEDWPLKRIDSLLRAILRCGSFELLRRKDVPPKVIITEYIDVAKAFFEGDEPGLVNGVLDRLAHDLREADLGNAKADGGA
ncbi:NusB antitermination factor [Roseibium hamelinense]|uniref:Transcription antitermination protein NusB n=1 Tax=Roseibium hamelinense TaxID=150831 RepID=A0A562TIA7_9HYPH|nr:transcription antitermination factor NusB [Roseibium hamelinense]MTI46192.1 transcription antitermination factor NusB [Roseibium hamelinense]TWI92616.1 NusB antitermination factor [Roseibium hamelinense]